MWTFRLEVPLRFVASRTLNVAIWEYTCAKCSRLHASEPEVALSPSCCMLLDFLHRVAENGWVYDRIQDLAGSRIVYGHLAEHLPSAPNRGLLLDVGGGTGRTSRIISDGWRYVCLDLERSKLVQFRRVNSRGLPLQADATKMPIASGVVDLVVCVAVSHHLSEAMLEEMLAEVHRILRQDGKFIFLDAILQPSRWCGLLLWRLDRGAHPRKGEQLKAAIAKRFRITVAQQFSVYHEYLLLACSPS
jgi:SAM-dependent methyltransferase